MLYVLPLEPLEERYTAQWYRWWRKALDTAGVEYRYVDGEQLTSSIEVGTVLDSVGTNYWKFTQLQEVCRLFKQGQVKEGDAFFTADLWHPGLEAIPYMSTLTKIPTKLYGFIHAGSYTTEDFAEVLADWAQYFERGWAKICDGIFTGTHYHKNKFIRKRLADLGVADKIHVTGYPFDTEEVWGDTTFTPALERPNQIVYSHRWDIEKRPNVFVQMMNLLWSRRQDFKVKITTSRPTFRTNEPWLVELLNICNFDYEVCMVSKRGYYDVLAGSKIFVSTTVEEGFGYCLLEAMTMGCAPVVPNDFSHVELLPHRDDRFLYNSMDEALDMLEHLLDATPDTSHLQERATYYDGSMARMIDLMEL